LQEMARVLSEVFRATDFIVRLGGDEFLVIARRMEYEIAGRRLKELDKKLKQYGESLCVKMGVSGGFFKALRDEKIQLSDAIKNAEGLMRQDKIVRKAGR
jgi:diguanylate cyclase (GGDEF)-like protein